MSDDAASDPSQLAGLFEQHRPRLRSVAYRLLGSLAEADDAVQEAWMLISVKGRPVSLIAVTVCGGRVTALDGITDLGRLARLGLTGLSASR